MKSANLPLVIIAGPTASGKSAHALRLAASGNGVIINADASQVYRDLKILSARPSAADEARIPHRLFGHVDGAEPHTAARWMAAAKTEISAAQQSGQLPILVGGTGLYLNSLLYGLSPIPDIPPAIRAEIRALPKTAVRAAVLAEDAVMAARLHANDHQRNARALEVIRATGQSLAIWQQRPRAGGIGAQLRLDASVIEIGRETLGARIDQRIAIMWQQGALAEVRTLAERQLAPDCPILRAIGVPPLLALLRGEIDTDTALQRWRLDTRAYAKRQSTWFRNQTPDWPRLTLPPGG